MIILIPAYEPDTRLPALVAQLRSEAPHVSVLVVDDGSGADYAPVFAATLDAGAEVLGYPVNHGKGHALKTGLRHAQRHYPGEDVVCADSDGQHTVRDILTIARRLREIDGAMVLGGRRFVGEVPARSRVGNAITRRAFRLATGIPLHDTQTGLRGYPTGMIDWLLGVRGDRFEYELNVLLHSRSQGIAIEEVEIETVYLEQNVSSHFRPILDSARVFAPLLAFVASSLGAFVVDAVALVALYALTSSLLFSVTGARVLSASLNFTVNRQAVFRGERGNVKRDLLRYLALAVALLASSYVWLQVLTQWGIPLVAAKLITDATLYVISFQVQRRFVFASAPTAARARELRASERELASSSSRRP